MAFEGLGGPAGGITSQGTMGGSPGGVISISFTRGSIRYDSPFLDMTSTFLPRTIKGLLRFIAAFILGDGLASQCISKMSEYPITNLLYDDQTPSGVKNDATIGKWKDILEKKLKIIRSIKQAGMDYYTYGNSVISINYPFKRMLKCPRCKHEHDSIALKSKFRSFKFHADCITPKCGYKGEMEARDINTKEIDKLSIVHWDLIYMDIKYNSITGDHFYFYTIPPDVSNAVRRGDMDIVNATRLEIIEAVKRRKQLKLMGDNVFHLKRPAPQYIIPSERGWGVPIVMPVLKDIFHVRVLKKGNEMIAFDHIVPLRILFPQGTGDVSPHAVMNLNTWKTKIEEEIRKWRADPNYISIVPIPLGMQNLGGDGRLLLATPEIRSTEDSIIMGFGMIPEIIRGGASWSGSNVSLRVVENTFLNHRTSMLDMISFIVDNVSRYFDLPKVDVSMSDFKMADDLQKKQMMLNAAAGNPSDTLISKTTALKELDFDPEVEFKNRVKELKKIVELKVEEAEGTAEANGSAAVINSMFQADAEIGYQSRSETRQRENQSKRNEQLNAQKEDNASGVQADVESFATQSGKDPAQVSIPNLILTLTQRFARLAGINQEEFKIRMLAMKHSTPNLYEEIYNNLKEMNLIAADLTPDLQVAQQQTPGELPSYTQGDTNAETPPSSVEQGANPQIVAQPISQIKSDALPEVRPPRSPKSSI